MIDAGRLDTFIEILEPVMKVDEYGTQVTEWPIFCSTRCGEIKRSGRRALIEGVVTELVQKEIILRYRPGVTAKMRVRFVEDGSVYAIQQADSSHRNGHIRLQLSTIADNNG